MSMSDPTPENLIAAAGAFDAAYPSPFPQHPSVLMRAAAKRIALLEAAAEESLNIWKSEPLRWRLDTKKNLGEALRAAGYLKEDKPHE